MAVLALLEDIANGRIRNERISKSYILLEICTELGPGLERQTARSHALPLPIQVLTTLGFLATGSFQRELADRSGMSQGSEPRHCFKRDHPHLSQETLHSLNVQIICDAQMRLTNIVARWPGSTHDSFVLTNSSVGNRLEPGIVERAIGQLKSRWRCLDRSGGMLLYHPEKVCRIVQACGVLHNIAHRHGVPLREVMALPDDPDPGPNNAQPNAEAIRTRQQLIARI
ncbi:putative nuclease HARBI1 [Merluccius polli]|uniref:Nuclease HARBI1 n=1 Tax=Merluccius polli TaxID=89951 RepID=A0AA47P610_MERPO|nr:putative nuclease HARBI1 [Merluccius polli]